jgi:NAD-dependent dihydropyrimidine dehydrogenase PreA subunit
LTHVVTQPCIGSKDHSCVAVCPVDCIHPRDTDDLAAAEQVFIDPAACIDCGACVELCPVGAIYPEGDVPAQWQRFIALNAEHFAPA